MPQCTNVVSVPLNTYVFVNMSYSSVFYTMELATHILTFDHDYIRAAIVALDVVWGPDLISNARAGNLAVSIFRIRGNLKPDPQRYPRMP